MVFFGPGLVPIVVLAGLARWLWLRESRTIAWLATLPVVMATLHLLFNAIAIGCKGDPLKSPVRECRPALLDPVAAHFDILFANALASLAVTVLVVAVSVIRRLRRPGLRG